MINVLNYSTKNRNEVHTKLSSSIYLIINVFTLQSLYEFVLTVSCKHVGLKKNIMIRQQYTDTGLILN